MNNFHMKIRKLCPAAVVGALYVIGLPLIRNLPKMKFFREAEARTNG